MRDRRRIPINVSALLISTVIGVGTNLATASTESWWGPAHLAAATAVYWLPAAILVVIVWESTQRWRHRLAHPWRTSESPYAGLEQYGPDRSTVFFGRDREINECLQALAQSRARAAGRIVMLVGPSGVGKSSLIAAGVLPRLSRQWTVCGPVVPGPDPFVSLAQALEPVATPSATLELADQLRLEFAGLDAGARPGALTASMVRRRAGRSHMLLVLDQGDDLTQDTSLDDGRLLIHGLLNAVASDPTLNVLIALRPDDLAKLGDLPGTTVPVGPMTTDQLREVVVRPAQAAGVYLDPTLVDTIVAEATVGDALPLLSELLRQLWQEHGDAIALADYDRAGRVAGSIAAHAERTYIATSTHFGSNEVDDVLIRFVDWDGAMLKRRHVDTAELQEQHPAIVAAFRADRLVIDHDNGRYVSLVHDALLRQWGRLKGLAYSADTRLRLRASLERRAHDWHRDGRRDDDLLAGAALIDAEDVAQALGTSAALSEFVAASRSATRAAMQYQASMAALWAQHLRTIDRDYAVTLAREALEEAPDELDPVILWTLWSLSKEPHQRQLRLPYRSEPLSMAWHGNELMTIGSEGNVCRWTSAATLITQQSLSLSHSNKAIFTEDGARLMISTDEEIYYWTTAPIAASSERHRLRWASSRYRIGWSADGSRYAYQLADGSVAIGEVTDAELPEITYDPTADYAQPVWSPPGDRIAWVRGTTIRVGHSRPGASRLSLAAASRIYAISWSPDGQRLLCLATPEHRVGAPTVHHLQVFDVDAQKVVQHVVMDVPAYSGRGITSACWSPDSKSIATLIHSLRDVNSDTAESAQAEIWLYHLGKEQPYRRVLLTIAASSHTASLQHRPVTRRTITWSPDGDALACADSTGLCIYQISTGKTFHASQPTLRNSVWSPDRNMLALTARHSVVLHGWDRSQPVELHPAFTWQLAPTAISWAPGGDRIAATNFDAIAIWDAERRNLLRRIPDLQPGVAEIDWSPDGRLLLRASTDWWGRHPPEVVIFDVESGERRVNVRSASPGGAITAWSPTGDRLAVSRDRNTLVILDTFSWAEVASSEDSSPQLRALSWSPDGSMIAAVDARASLYLRDGATGVILRRLIDDSLINPLQFGAERCVAWSPCSRFIATAGSRTTTVWNASTGLSCAAFDVPSSETGVRPMIHRIHWSPRGLELHLTLDDATVASWKLPGTIDDFGDDLPPRRDLPSSTRMRFGLRPSSPTLDTPNSEGRHNRR